MFKGTIIALFTLTMAFGTYAAPIAAPVAAPVAVAVTADIAAPVLPREALSPVPELIERNTKGMAGHKRNKKGMGGHKRNTKGMGGH